MHDRLRLTQAKMSDEAQLELLAPWYTQNTSESRTLDFFDAIPKYPFAVTTGIPKPERLEVPFTLRGKKYTAFVAPAQITDARTGQERLVFPGSGERQKVGGQAALRSGSCVCGCDLNFGYQRRNRSSRSSLRTLVLVCSKRWAPRSVHCICCFLTNRLLTT
jgi:hypothetical protein